MRYPVFLNIFPAWKPHLRSGEKYSRISLLREGEWLQVLCSGKEDKRQSKHKYPEVNQVEKRLRRLSYWSDCYNYKMEATIGILNQRIRVRYPSSWTSPLKAVIGEARSWCPAFFRIGILQAGMECFIWDSCFPLERLLFNPASQMSRTGIPHQLEISGTKKLVSAESFTKRSAKVATFER